MSLMPLMPVTPTTTAATAAAPAPRGFVIDRADRGDGRTQLPGSLHTNRRLSQWLSLAEPGVVQVCTGKVELGQGILTALQLLVAEELDVPLSAVRIHSASTVRGPDEGVTSGSLSVQDSGGALRHACAELRAMALQRAAARAGGGAASGAGNGAANGEANGAANGTANGMGRWPLRAGENRSHRVPTP